MKNKTMNDIYRDGSEHEACSVCGLCKDCGDCECQQSNNFTDRRERVSEQEEFEEWFKTKPWLTDGSSKYWIGWQACAEQKNKIIDKQAAELAALRGFANALIKNSDVMYRYYVHTSARKYGLQDESGNPTKLLTGEE